MRFRVRPAVRLKADATRPTGHGASGVSRTSNAANAASSNNVRLCRLGVLGVLVASACGGTRLFPQYEYEEDVYLSLDGTATVYVNSSIPALNALRGTSFEASPAARVDRDAVRAYYSSPATTVAWVRQSRRNGRRFVHVRLDVSDISRLHTVAPFAWSTYRFYPDGEQLVYRQRVGAAVPPRPGAAPPAWTTLTPVTGRELVAFRLHLPSKIDFHNSGHNVGRGNILVWEQPLADRLRGAPLAMEARMQTQSILYRTLWLFGATFVAVSIAFVVVIWWVLRRGVPLPVEADHRVRPGTGH